jgi:hypothetical protein
MGPKNIPSVPQERDDACGQDQGDDAKRGDILFSTSLNKKRTVRNNQCTKFGSNATSLPSLTFTLFRLPSSSHHPDCQFGTSSGTPMMSRRTERIGKEKKSPLKTSSINDSPMEWVSSGLCDVEANKIKRKQETSSPSPFPSIPLQRFATFSAFLHNPRPCHRRFPLRAQFFDVR